MTTQNESENNMYGPYPLYMLIRGYCILDFGCILIGHGENANLMGVPQNVSKIEGLIVCSMGPPIDG